MAEKLKQLFDFQRFAKNRKLAAMISETEDRYSRELSDEDLGQVAAAGITQHYKPHARKNQHLQPKKNNN